VVFGQRHLSIECWAQCLFLQLGQRGAFTAGFGFYHGKKLPNASLPDLAEMRGAGQGRIP